MEEHHQAYFFWKYLGIKQAWCWHIDAHLDIGREGLGPQRLQAISQSSSDAEVEQAHALGCCYLPWGGLHCGNYLYPAIKEGLVQRLTWVIPDHLPIGDLLSWARRHLDGWFELSLTEAASLRVMDGRVTGTVLGIPIEVGTWDSLSAPQEPILLDVDIDYFLTEKGEVWCHPDLIAKTVANWPILATTVAYSVKGGYTPPQHRWLADPFLIAPLTPGYLAHPLDRAVALHRQHRFQDALAALEPLHADHPIEVTYYRGSCHEKLKQFQQALNTWESLVDHLSVPTDGRAYLYGLCGELCLKLEDFDRAITYAKLGKRLAPDDPRHPWTEAVALESQGDLKAALRQVRQALRLAGSGFFSQRVRLALARLYRRAGNYPLYKAELARLAANDITGEYRASTVLS